jgi:lysozyme
MQLSEVGLELIMNSEGFRSQTYLDVAGFPTIGYGHRLLAHESYPDGISEALARQILTRDVFGAGQAVSRLVKVELTQNQFDALVDFCYNLGSGRLASSTLLKALNAGRYDAARQQLLLWDLSGGKECPGLKSRREAEFQLWGAPAAAQSAAA